MGDKTSASVTSSPQFTPSKKKRKPHAELFVEANRNLFSDHIARLPLCDPRVKELPR